MSTEPTAGGELYGTTAIKNNQLERFDNRTLVRRYTIDFTCPEFTCLCPRSGFPDFATIHIKYRDASPKVRELAAFDDPTLFHQFLSANPVEWVSSAVRLIDYFAESSGLPPLPLEHLGQLLGITSKRSAPRGRSLH